MTQVARDSGPVVMLIVCSMLAAVVMGSSAITDYPLNFHAIQQRSDPVVGPSPVLAVMGPKAAVSPGVTMANYLSLSVGMSHEEVSAILGSAGTEQSRISLGDLTTVNYIWRGWLTSNMSAMFQNDQLVLKAQYGLR